MCDKWTEIFSGKVEDRKVTLYRYSSGELKVSTTQKNDDMTEGSSDGTNHLFPCPILAGAKIEVHGSTIEELKAELLLIDFSGQAAQEIIDKVPK